MHNVIDHIGLIKSVIHDMGIPSWYPEYNELVDVGQKAFEIAVNSYDESKSLLSHWAYMKIRWYIINYYHRHATKIKHLTEDYSLDDEKALLKVEFLTATSAFEDRILNKLSLQSIIETMPKRTQKILSLYYWHGYKFSEISKALNMTQTAIYAVHKKALRKLRRHYER